MIERFAGEEGAGFTSDWSVTTGARDESARPASWLRRATVTVLMGVTLGWAVLAVGALVLLLTLVMATVKGGRWLVGGKAEEPSVLREARTIVEQALGGV